MRMMKSFTFKKAYNAFDYGCLACARPSGYDKHAVSHCFPDGFLLLVRKYYTLFFLNLLYPFLKVLHIGAIPYLGKFHQLSAYSSSAW